METILCPGGVSAVLLLAAETCSHPNEAVHPHRRVGRVQLE